PKPGITLRGGRRVCARGSRRTAISQRHTPAQPGGKLVNGAEIIRFQLRVIIEDLLLRHACGEPIQHVPYRDAQPTDTRLAGAFAWLDRDTGAHALRISLARRSAPLWFLDYSPQVVLDPEIPRSAFTTFNEPSRLDHRSVSACSQIFKLFA